MPKWEPAADRGLWALSDPQLSNPSQDEKEVLLWSEELGSICNSLSPSPTHLSHTTNINPFENKVWEIYFYKEVCSFVHWSSSLLLIMFWIYLYMYTYGWLIGFNGISTSIGYLMPKPVYTYVRFVCICTRLYNIGNHLVRSHTIINLSPLGQSKESLINNNIRIHM